MTALLHGMRMAGDLLIYSAFASFFVTCLGGRPMPWLLLLPAVCYGASACLSRSRALRTGCGAVCLLGLLALPGWVDRAAFLPALLYTLYLTWQGEYLLSADRQSEVFLLFCKVYPVFALVLGMVWDGKVMRTVSLPLAIWAVFLQIFFMRVLRQAPDARRDPVYLLGNAGSLLVPGAVCFLLSRPAVLGGAERAAGAVYFGLVVPVLEVPLALVAWLAEHLLMPAILAFLGWIAARSGNPNPDLLAEMSGQTAGGREIPAAGEPLLDGELLLKGIGFALLAAGCVLLFRRLVQKDKGSAAGVGPAEARQVFPRPRRRWPSFFLSPNARVRRAYGRYLERQALHGAARKPSETSLDRLGLTPCLDPEAEAQLRRLYLKARYGECATSRDAAEAQRLEKSLELSEESQKDA